jgi:hypothetical protein
MYFRPLIPRSFEEVPNKGQDYDGDSPEPDDFPKLQVLPQRDRHGTPYFAARHR